MINPIPKTTLQQAYKMGYDCEANGVNEKNCHFSLFSTKEKMKAWERGKKQAKLDTEEAQEG